MISVTEIQQIHDILIDNFGGIKGIRDVSSLESAITRPFQSFESNELYSTVIEKGAAIIESLLINHPFIDGNKRTGYVILRLFLLKNNLDIIASQEEKYQFVINIAAGNTRFIEIVEWLKANTHPTGTV